MRARRGKGRPKLPVDRVKKLTVSIAVTIEEHKRITQVAAADDLSVSAWARRWVFEGLKRQGG